MGRQLLLPDMMPAVGGLLPRDSSPCRSMPNHWCRGKRPLKLLSNRQSEHLSSSAADAGQRGRHRDSQSEPTLCFW